MNRFLFLALRIIVAVILIQTLRFKFLAHPDSVFIFSQAGLEPEGRYIIGFLELIAAFLIIFPRTVWLGAGLTLGVISGAIFLHLTKIGIEVQGDGGALFYTAILVFVFSALILWHERNHIPLIGNKL
jgi:putative oxidoreductase